MVRCLDPGYYIKGALWRFCVLVVSRRLSRRLSLSRFCEMSIFARRLLVFFLVSSLRGKSGERETHHHHQIIGILKKWVPKNQRASLVSLSRLSLSLCCSALFETKEPPPPQKKCWSSKRTTTTKKNNTTTRRRLVKTTQRKGERFFI